MFVQSGFEHIDALPGDIFGYWVPKVVFFLFRYHGSSSSIKYHVYHHVGGRHTPAVCNESREAHTSHYPSRPVTKRKKPTNYSYQPRGRDISSPAIWATKISAHFSDNNVAQKSRRLNGQICSHTPSALNEGAKRSDVPYGHASMLLLGEESEATEPYIKYANHWVSVLKCPRSIELSGCMISFLNSFCFLSWLDFFVCRPAWGHMMNGEAFF